MSETPKISEALRQTLAYLDRPSILIEDWYRIAPENVAALRAALPIAKKLEQSNDSLRAELEQAKRQCESLRDERGKATDLIVKLSDREPDKIKDLRAQVEQAKDECENWRIEAGMRTVDINDLRTELDQAKQERDHHAETLVDYKIGNDNLRAEREQLQRARIGDSEIIGRWQCEAEKTKEQVEQLTKERDEWKSGYAQVQAEASDKTVLVEKLHKWFTKVFGEVMNGRDFDVKCSMAEREVQQLKAIVTSPEPLEFAYKLIEQLKADNARLLMNLSALVAYKDECLAYNEAALKTVLQTLDAMKESQ